MAEKADLPTSDSVSLPPTYAPSETFTDSPPPPYKRVNITAVRIARIVCFTILALTFIVGFFIVTHRLVANKECDCQQVSSSDKIQHAALFAEAPPNLPNPDLNNNKIEEGIESKSSELPSRNVLKEDENLPSNQVVEEAEGLVKEENEEAEEEIEELSRDVELPKDLLLGNPKMAGRNVHCKVEKRQRKIAEGIMTQAIIVTCDDDSDDDNEEETPSLPLLPRPPMSLLSTIMKVLSSRPRSLENRLPVEPQRLPFPLNQNQRPIPIIRPLRGPLPGPFHGPVSPIFVPLRKLEFRRPIPIVTDDNDAPPSFLRRLPHPPPRFEGRSPRMHDLPPPMRFRPIQEENIHRLPFPLPNGPVPLRLIRLPARRNDIDEDERPNFPAEEDGPFPPFPFHPPGRPVIRFIPNGKRIIRLMPRQNSDNSPNEPFPFPVPRGAFSLHHEHNEPPMPHHSMPEASGRALPAPVALPGVRVVRLPFRPQPQLFREAKLITHMEVRQKSEEDNENEENRPINILPPIAEENQNIQTNNKEFGPPKMHTVIESVPKPIIDDESPLERPFHREPITQTQSQPRFVAPPPPRFAREGRTSFMAQLNPDAEVIPIDSEDQPLPQPRVQRIVLN